MLSQVGIPSAGIRGIVPFILPWRRPKSVRRVDQVQDHPRPCRLTGTLCTWRPQDRARDVLDQRSDEPSPNQQPSRIVLVEPEQLAELIPRTAGHRLRQFVTGSRSPEEWSCSVRVLLDAGTPGSAIRTARPQRRSFAITKVEMERGAYLGSP
jgi:hypothetical protein